MANLKEQNKWETGIYRIEESDPVVGGEEGVSNKPLKQLANRTFYLHELIKAVVARAITAGNGLTGGGTLGASRTISLGTPSKITATSTNVAGGNTHTHEIDKASTSVAGVVKLNDSLTSNANNEALTAKQGRELKHLIDGLGTPFQNFSATSSLDNTTNLNDLKGAGKYGVYSQSSNSNALTALNYPEQKAGALFVLPSAYQGIQLYVPFDNQIIYIRRTNQASGFENWRIIGEVIDNLNSDSKTAGLSARQGKLLNENKAEKTEVMPLQRTSLSATDDLNDFRQNGIFAQTTSARASVERNYPEAIAGVLEVLYNGNFQRYTTFNSVCYQRDYRSGKWQDWRRVDSLGKVDRAGDTINGLLRINAQSGWSLLRLGTNQGYWDLEANPNSESDRRLNLKYTNDSGSSTYIRFPATTVEQNIAYQKWVDEQINKKSLPLGAIVGFPKEITNPAGFLKCDGSTFAQASYHDLYKAMGNKNTLPNLNGEIGQIAPFAVNNLPEGWIWFDEISSKVKQTNHPELYRLLIAQYGSLAKVPKLDDRFIRNIGSNLTIGQLQDDEIKRHRHLSNWGEHNSSSQDIERDTSKTIKGAHGSDNDNANYYTSYTGGEETRPKAIAFKFAIKATNTVNYWIKAYGEVINTGSLNAANLALALQGKADKNHTHTFSDIINFTQGVANSISSSKTENGWCKLPNGLMMMWGNFKTGRIGNEIKGEVFFPIAFPNTAFSVTLSGAHGIISSGGTSWEGFSISELTNAKFQWHSSWQSRSTEQGESKIYWFAIGY